MVRFTWRSVPKGPKCGQCSERDLHLHYRPRPATPPLLWTIAGAQHASTIPHTAPISGTRHNSLYNAGIHTCQEGLRLDQAPREAHQLLPTSSSRGDSPRDPSARNHRPGSSSHDPEG
jgi:hypothetical protein